MPKIIGIAGMPAAGKTTVAKALNKDGIKLIHLGDFIWEYLKRKHIRRNQETGNMTSLYFWAEYRDIPIAEWAYEQIKKTKYKSYIVDGIRTLEEVLFFKSKFKNNFKLISIVASPATRKSREKKRKRFSKVNFEMRDKEELTIGVGDVIASSDYYIDGNKTKKEVVLQANQIFRKIAWGKSL
ncbi:MAG: AAA family ATPase [Candidatus Woesearchaeota archaeon]|nr:MAG: AAA family ATPase [Candidatus Woesearchaeota archaeon]